jgi:hypothetical protein
MRAVSAAKSFLLSRCYREVPLRTVFWRDMIGVATALNILTGLELAGIVLLVSGFPVAIALPVHFGLLPWNIFLFLAVWRGADRITPSEALVVRTLAAVWLVAMVVI